LRSTRWITHQLPDGRIGRAFGQRRQVGERQSAPWRAQHGEPCHLVGEMLERARQCEQVTNQRTRQQLLELYRSEPQSGFAQRRHDLRQVWAGAYQQRD
jgi:hypothetical protein